MVTTQGFNAMLKVLEEPPEHVRFIFCTTEPHKVIEAIRSRCQRHDFRRIRTAALVQDFARICEAEEVDIEPAARAGGQGGRRLHRDGLSRLDQVLTFAGPKVTLADVAQVLGALPVELRFDLAEALAAHRVADVLACVERVVDAGHDLHQFTREALEHLRDLYVLRVAPSTTLVDVTAETRERLAAQAERFGPGELGAWSPSSATCTWTCAPPPTSAWWWRSAWPGRPCPRPRWTPRPCWPGSSAWSAGSPSPGPRAPPRRPAPGGRRRAHRQGGLGPRPRARPRRPRPEAPSRPAETPARAVPAAQAKPRSKAKAARAEAPAEEAGWGPAEAPARVPVDLDLVRRSWPLVLERVQAASRLTASFLGHGRPVALEGRQLVVELPKDRRFEAEALAKDGRNRQVDGVLEAMLGGGLEIRVVVGDHTVPPTPTHRAARPPAPDQVVEFEVDPANDEGRP